MLKIDSCTSHKKCSLLDFQHFDLFNNPNNADSWYCANCTAKKLPFNNLNDSHFLLLQNDLMDNASDDLKLYPDDSFNQFTESCETLALNFEDMMKMISLTILILNIIIFTSLIILNLTYLHP